MSSWNRLVLIGFLDVIHGERLWFMACPKMEIRRVTLIHHLQNYTVMLWMEV
ncbi:hypothetical protein D3C72_2575280 [compost metagenome]